MSYARFGVAGSDVYAFLSVGGHLECCGCALSRDSTAFATTAELITHLEKHRTAGHTVPQATIDTLRAEAQANDQFIAEEQAKAAAQQ